MVVRSAFTSSLGGGSAASGGGCPARLGLVPCRPAMTPVRRDFREDRGRWYRAGGGVRRGVGVRAGPSLDRVRVTPRRFGDSHDPRWVVGHHGPVGVVWAGWPPLEAFHAHPSCEGGVCGGPLGLLGRRQAGRSVGVGGSRPGPSGPYRIFTSAAARRSGCGAGDRPSVGGWRGGGPSWERGVRGAGLGARPGGEGSGVGRAGEPGSGFQWRGQSLDGGSGGVGVGRRGVTPRCLERLPRPVLGRGGPPSARAGREGGVARRGSQARGVSPGAPGIYPGGGGRLVGRGGWEPTRPG